MKLFEVIFWGSQGGEDAKDAIYLVRAPDFQTAIEAVQRNASPSDLNRERFSMVDVVYEIGADLSECADSNPRILRGPFFAHAYNFGWRSWHRKIEESGSTYEWEEQSANAG